MEDAQPLGANKDIRLRSHGHVLPDALQTAASTLAEQYGSIELALWRSFLRLFGFMASMQPAALIYTKVKGQFEELYSGVRAHEKSMFECKIHRPKPRHGIPITIQRGGPPLAGLV